MHHGSMYKVFKTHERRLDAPISASTTYATPARPWLHKPVRRFAN